MAHTTQQNEGKPSHTLQLAMICGQHMVAVRYGDNGQLFALETWVNLNTGENGSTFVNVTTWSKTKLYQWLGY